MTQFAWMRPMQYLRPFVLYSLWLLCPSFLAAKAFEGTVRMKITTERSEVHELAYSIKGDRIRTDFEVGKNMTASAIMNLGRDEMIILMPGQPMYLIMSIKETVEKATGQKAETATLENTGIKTKILGYTCTQYLAKSKAGVAEIWATSELGTFMGLGQAMGSLGRGPSKAGWEQAIVGKNFFPLRVLGEAKGRESFSLETIAIEPRSLPESLFVPPDGYRKFDMGAMRLPSFGG